jgi:hypothetical protein
VVVGAVVVVVVGAVVVVVVVGAVVVVVVVVVGAVVVVVLVVVVLVVVVLVVVVLVVVVLVLVVVVLVLVVDAPNAQWLTVRFEFFPSSPSFVLADCRTAPAGVNTVKWTDPPPCSTPFTGLDVIASGLKSKVICQVGPASGCVRMNSHCCWPAGVPGSLVVVLAQTPPGAPWPVQVTSAATATPTSSTSVARTATIATPVFVKRRRKRLMTLSLPATQAVSSRRGSLGVARYQRLVRNARTTGRGPISKAFVPFDAYVDANRVCSTALGVRPNPSPSRGSRGQQVPAPRACTTTRWIKRADAPPATA